MVRGGNREGSYRADCVFFTWGMEKAHVTDDVIGVDQKIPDGLTKSMFLGVFEMAIRSGIKSR